MNKEFPSGRPQRTDILRAVDDFFFSQSLMPRQDAHCPDCGSMMLNTETTFSLFGSEKMWNLSLPICQRCCGSQSRARLVLPPII